MIPHFDEIWRDLDQNKFARILNENALVCFLDLRGQFIYISDALGVILVNESDGLMSRNLNVLSPLEKTEDVNYDLWEALQKHEEWQGILSFPAGHQEHINLRATFSLIENRKHQPHFYIGIFNLTAQHSTFQDYIENDLSYKSFFKRSSNVKSLFDLTTFQYVDVNDAWKKYTGLKKEDALGLTPQQLNVHDLFDLEFILKVQSSELEFFTIDNGGFHINNKANKDAVFTYEKITINGKNYLLEIVTDVPAQSKYQKELKRNSKKAVKKKVAILKMAGLVGGDVTYVFKEITKLCAEVLQIDRVSIWKFNEDKTNLFFVSAFTLNEKDHCTDFKFKAYKIQEYFNLLLKNKTVLINDTVKNELTKNIVEDYLLPLGITSSLDVVIPGHYSPYGVVCFQHIGPKKEWTVEDEEFAMSISNIISLAIECEKRNTVETELLASNEKLFVLNSELKKLKKGLEQENIYLREEIDLVFNYEEMVYGSKSFSQVLTDVESVAVTNATVILLGESGTGKELLARAIHNISARKNRPLIKVNCAAIPRELLESELFGHKKGSFTGAIHNKLGKFQLADGGTLFLDEIGELPLEMQPKLLRAIQESEIEQIGSTTTQKVDIRIIAATNRNLEIEVKEKRFREDLYFRINVFPITIPPLRERVEDIPILIEHFVNKYTKLYHKKITFISQATKHNLQSYSWPGNVRELENLIERAVILSNDNILMIPNFKSSPRRALISTTVLSLEDVQRIHIIKILKQCDWKIDGIDGASDLLQIKPSTLRDRMKKLGIEKPL